MAEGSSGAVWFGAPGFEVLDVVHDGDEVVVEVQTTATVVGCARCGVRAKCKDRRWVTLRDAPVGDSAVLVRWRKRIWACPEPDCSAKTWTERAELAAPRRVLTNRAEMWATNRVAAVEGTPASDRPELRGLVVDGVGRGRTCQPDPGGRPDPGGPDRNGRLR